MQVFTLVVLAIFCTDQVQLYRLDPLLDSSSYEHFLGENPGQGRKLLESERAGRADFDTHNHKNNLEHQIHVFLGIKVFAFLSL